MNSVAVIVPAYKAVPDADEQKCFERICRIFHDYPIVLCNPQDLDTSYYRKVYPPLRFLSMNKDYFLSTAAYNRLMLSSEFYAAFLKQYDYILICQLDVWVFRNNLPQWIDKNYDYIGAPWHNRALHLIQYFTVKQGIKTVFRALKGRNFNHAVGNGGFSLRKVQAFFEICKTNQTSIWKANEDYFWSFLAKHPDGTKLRVPTDTEAAAFCIETDARHYMKDRTLPPMAVHAYKKYDFSYWKSFISQTV